MTCCHGKWEPACIICKPIQMPSDQAYRNFAYTFKTGVRKEIYSKRQFERECRAHGLRSVSREDLVKQGRPYQPDPKESGLPAQEVQSIIRQVRQSATPDRVNRHWDRIQRNRCTQAVSSA